MRQDIDVQFFKKSLEDRLDVISAAKEAGRNETASVELDQTRVGRLSRMDAMQQRAMSQATARLSDAESLRIHTALSRIESEGYGYCMLCDEEIAEKRLQFDPSILICISCAQEAENK